MLDSQAFHAVAEFLDFRFIRSSRFVKIIRADSTVQVPPSNVLEMIGFAASDPTACKGIGNGNALF